MSEEKPSLTIVRRLKAPPAPVYAAWTRPELMARWWGPDAGPVLSAEADPRTPAGAGRSKSWAVSSPNWKARTLVIEATVRKAHPVALV